MWILRRSQTLLLPSIRPSFAPVFAELKIRDLWWIERERLSFSRYLDRRVRDSLRFLASLEGGKPFWEVFHLCSCALYRRKAFGYLGVGSGVHAFFAHCLRAICRCGPLVPWHNETAYMADQTAYIRDRTCVRCRPGFGAASEWSICLIIGNTVPDRFLDRPNSRI